LSRRWLRSAREGSLIQCLNSGICGRQRRAIAAADVAVDGALVPAIPVFVPWRLSRRGAMLATKTQTGAWRPTEEIA